MKPYHTPLIQAEFCIPGFVGINPSPEAEITWRESKTRLALRFIDYNDVLSDLVDRHTRRKKKLERLQKKQKQEEAEPTPLEGLSFWRRNTTRIKRRIRPLRIWWHSWRLPQVRQYIQEFTVDQIKLQARPDHGLYLKKQQEFTRLEEAEAGHVVDQVIGQTPERIYVLIANDPQQIRGVRTLDYFA